MGRVTPISKMAAAAANFKINELLQDGQVLSEFIEY
jgi:hypothetical protein